MRIPARPDQELSTLPKRETRNASLPDPSPDFLTYRSVRVFSSLDGLRCLAILAVIWHHAGNAEEIIRGFPAAGFGFLGVDLFFEISGFLIVTLLLRERAASGRIRLRRFYARRFLRIFPLYYGVLAAFAILYFVFRRDGSGAAAFRQELPVMLLYLSNWIPVSGMFAITWSLAAEEQFYAVWPPLEKWFKKHTAKLALAVVIVSHVIQLGWLDRQLAAWFGWSPDEPAFLRQTTFAPIGIGVLLAHVLHHAKGYERVHRWLGRRAAAPVALALLVALANGLPDDIRGPGRLMVHLVMGVLLASCVVREDNGLRWFLTFRPLARIGTLSYGIYLLHHIGLWLLNKLYPIGEMHLLWVFGLGSLISVAIAELSYRLFETRFLKLKVRFR